MSGTIDALAQRLRGLWTIDKVEAQNIINAELVAHGELTITQGGQAVVDPGVATDAHLLVAYGFAEPDPTNDQGVTFKIEWDQASTSTRVRFLADTGSADPTVNYSIYRVTDTQP